jgi:hypothetical protein
MAKAKSSFPPLADDREYLCMGPNCWGRDKDAKKAIATAKKHSSYDRTGWKYLLFDAPKGSWVNDWGQIEWTIPEGTNPAQPVERFRFNVPVKP